MSVSAPDRPATSASGSAPDRQLGWPLGPSLVILLGLAGVAALGVRGWAPPFAQGSGTVLQGAAAWTVVGAATGLTLLLVLVALLGTGSWRYNGATDRDERLDLVRGMAICFVVLNHINMPSLFQLVTQETLAPVSGAELFVALSGVVLGIVYRRRLDQIDLLSATGALWQRAGRLYKTSLLVVVTIFLVTLVPGVDGTVVKNFVDQRTGQNYGLYPNMERLLDYPVPGFVLRDILLLRLGPYQFNILGLYVVLLLVSPLLIAALRRRLVWLALLVSWGLYLLNTVYPVTVFGSQFEEPFPLLSWQLLFVHGMAAGWYWPRLLAWAGTGWGKAVIVLAVLVSLALAVFSWNNPFLSNGYDVRLALIPDAQFLALYEAWFLRPTLGPGRVLATGLLLVTLYALLTAYWRPLRAALGWFLVPLGQASLYVFVLQVFFALLVANVPGLGGANVLLNTAAHALVLATIWLMVRHRFLFSVIPR
jgi:hypothetical protein